MINTLVDYQNSLKIKRQKARILSSFIDELDKKLGVLTIAKEIAI